jgi:hemerythrin-like metal-binding protein
MEKITWDDSFNIQVDVIDQQHRRLVELMNRLIAIQDEKASDDEIAEILGAMTNYLGYHFDTEEQLMIDRGYPELESHREEHQTFVTQTANFIATYRQSGVSLKSDILLFLKEWLVEHIVKTDAHFGQFMKDIRSE